ncbi:hypothetical protein [Pseudoroseomonas sp. WGS1072]|uniref:hypothetical protein n=1 Tax=Roseomonas sp. WGS1072 TaxID=3366816 RepID=UPI003BF1AC45
MSPSRSDSVRHLPMFEHALLWAMRFWGWQCRGCCAAPLARIGQVFADLGAPEAAADFHGMMRGLFATRSGQPRLSPLGDTALAPDERLLLDVLALQQARRSAEGVALLGMLIPHDRALTGYACIVRLIAAFNAAGHRLERPLAAASAGPLVVWPAPVAARRRADPVASRPAD